MRQEVKTEEKDGSRPFTRVSNYNNLGGKILMFSIEGQKKFQKKINR